MRLPVELLLPTLKVSVMLHAGTEKRDLLSVLLSLLLSSMY